MIIKSDSQYRHLNFLRHMGDQISQGCNRHISKNVSSSDLEKVVKASLTKACYVKNLYCYIPSK